MMLCICRKPGRGSRLALPLLVAQGTLWHGMANGHVPLVFLSVSHHAASSTFLCLSLVRTLVFRIMDLCVSWDDVP